VVRPNCVEISLRQEDAAGGHSHPADKILSRPDGLRTGSPPFPPPRSIRPTVRRLPRSPRFMGPGPRRDHYHTTVESPFRKLVSSFRAQVITNRGIVEVLT
jgi:hypothetical protein